MPESSNTPPIWRIILGFSFANLPINSCQRFGKNMGPRPSNMSIRASAVTTIENVIVSPLVMVLVIKINPNLIAQIGVLVLVIETNSYFFVAFK